MSSLRTRYRCRRGFALPLGGCVNFDPADWFAGDWFNTKKPLPGERKPLFPDGVPGVRGASRRTS